MRSSKWISESHFLLACRARLAGKRVGQSGKKSPDTMIRRAKLLVLVMAVLAAMPVRRDRNRWSLLKIPRQLQESRPCGNLNLTYVRPTERTKVSNYVFDAFGPYPIAGAAFAAGINQLSNAPPEWGQGAEGYGKRFGSDFAIAAIGTTTRYGLAEAFKEDTLYYRCECSGPISAAAPCCDLHFDSAPRRRRPSRLLFPCACRALCGLDDCGLRMVSGPLRRKGCIPDGQLQPAGIYGRKHCPGVLL